MKYHEAESFIVSCAHVNGCEEELTVADYARACYLARSKSQDLGVVKADLHAVIDGNPVAQVTYYDGKRLGGWED